MPIDKDDLRPHPDKYRPSAARKRRWFAAEYASDRKIPITHSNREIKNYSPTWPTNYTKGLPHNEFGLVNESAFPKFVKAINETNVGDPRINPKFDVPHGPPSGTAFYSTLSDGMGGTKSPKSRSWESPRAGHVYDLQGPDACEVAMPPAPTLGSDELAAEIAEIYAMALLRDVPFHEFSNDAYKVNLFTTQGKPDDSSHDQGFTVGDVRAALEKLKWFGSGGDDTVKPSYAHLDFRINGLSEVEKRRRAARRKRDGETDNLFRGSLPGAKVGPYLSQFLLIGNSARGSQEPDASVESASGVALSATQARNISQSFTPMGELAHIEDGYINYGTQRIDQRIATRLPGRDFMTDWPLWLDAQNGADFRGAEIYVAARGFTPRFIATGRDLTTFVHLDALYQAYLNACLLMIAFEVDFSFGFPSGAFHPTRGSFATFGGPHILSLLTEVATRALKAVRRQKFNHHLRARPEALAGVVTLAANDKADLLGPAKERAEALLKQLGEDPGAEKTSKLLQWVNALNKRQNDQRGEDASIFPRVGANRPPFSPADGKNYLLPMAFPEGSPMHPSFGAGHATVAGACTTILKAFFELYSFKKERDPGDGPPNFRDNEFWNNEYKFSDLPAPGKMSGDIKPKKKLEKIYRAPFKHLSEDPDSAPDALKKLVVAGDAKDLTLKGELNKLAANIAIGRNWAGVHYYTDYYDSVRMGERVALGILQEQMLTYPEPVAMRFESFDGDRIVITTQGDGQHVTTCVCRRGSTTWKDYGEEYWLRDVTEFQVGTP